MIIWKSNTLFQGLFPIPSYKVKQALRKHDSIHCYYGGKEMIIKELDLKLKLVKESELFDDKSGINGKKQYSLYYYVWSPKTDDQRTKELLYY